MIRVILLGRTGNNLFQYALGRVLSSRHAVPLVLDGSWYDRAGWSEVSHFLSLQKHARVVRPIPLAHRFFRKVTGKHRWEFLRTPILREATGDMSFRAEFLRAPDDCVLFGYFQSPRYFESMAGEIRAEIQAVLTASHRDEPVRASLAAALGEPSSVAVHVRRGDYLKHPAFQVCDAKYYQRAIQRMRARIPRARFFLFSDDPNWCHRELPADDTEVVDLLPGQTNPLSDLFLMSRASHHIIANSSYSWWAAWLGLKKGQEVIAPHCWFLGEIDAPIEEKLCPGWVSLQPPQP